VRVKRSTWPGSGLARHCPTATLLTENDLETINGQRQQLEGTLQQRYGYTKERVKKGRRRLGEWTLTNST
jgi:hypothetical protein